MTVRISPAKARGTIPAPPSKSAAHRALIAAGLAAGTSRITGLSASRDVEATVSCLRALGARVELTGDVATVTGIDWTKPGAAPTLPCGESGSTLRFFLPLCLVRGEEQVLTGTERLFSRGLSVYEDICRDQGIFFEMGPDSVRVKGRLRGGLYPVRGDVSSQFLTGLLFALPLLPEDSEIRVTTRLESAPYIDLTLNALGEFGVRIQRPAPDRFLIPGGQLPRPRDVAVEGDWSNAAFLEALNLAGGDVTVTGLDEESAQGDKIYRSYFQALQKGCPTLDIADCPDLGPVLMAAAALCHGATLTGTARLKIKESDRGAAMAEELAKCGVTVTVEEDRILIPPQKLMPPKEALDGHNDHRIVMSMAVIASAVGGEIRGAQAVAKSFPDFFEILAELGVNSVETE